MVYTGKPSRGCGTCRQRRVKCDERKPTCFRCEKARRVCTGYRPEFEIVHRSENRAIERRMRTTATAGEHGTPTVRVNQEAGVWVRTSSGDWNKAPGYWSSSPSDGSSRSMSPPTRKRAMSPPVPVPVEEQASCHFAANFILVPLQGGGEGFFEFLLPLIAAEPPRSPLRHAFAACAYSSLGGTVKADGVNLEALAMQHHTEALTGTHHALGNPKAAKSDAVVATVLLLCLFENMMATKEMGMLAWRSHIEGAVHILKSRGKEQMQSETGRRLFRAVRQQLVSRAMSSSINPASEVDWWAPDKTQSDMLTTSQRYTFKIAELRGEVTSLMATVKRDAASLEVMLELSRRTLALDQEIATWLVNLPEKYQFKTLCWQDYPEYQPIDLLEAEVFPGRVDVYPSFVVSEAWNMARATRMMLGCIHIRLTAWICSPIDYRTTPEYETSMRICKGLIADTISSIPYHLGWHNKRRELFNTPELTSFACGEENSTKTLPGMFAAWPLACINAQDAATADQRTWCTGRLKHIANRLGLKYAHILAGVHMRFPSMMIRQDGLLPTKDPLAPMNQGLRVPRSPSRSP